ncbi:MAG: NAD(P)/FAD-dependent oxidoreductase [Sandaracinaceae bacterium]|nr:NAD(P)/FAD-dependent oxidoreductase [Sandaracinaceae bacterium]
MARRELVAATASGAYNCAHMQYDVIVVGGGPAGSTAAHLLAKRGAKVLLLEKDVFPRFHIGESLLPTDLIVFERLGVDLKGHARHLLKQGAEFFLEAEDKHATYRFTDSLAGTHNYAWQVERAAFDLELLELAARAGAEVHQGEPVTGVELGEHEIEAQTEKGRYRARYLIDATGLDAMLARKHRTMRSIKVFGLAAVFRHYADLPPAVVAELESTGNIKIAFVDEGWLWAIPLGSGRLSVGLVTRKKGVADAWLEAEIAASPLLRRLLERATPEGPHRRIGSFSFYNERSNGRRFACVGDSACFLDPVFSSGVTFGMLGAAHAADVLGPALEAGTEGDPALMDAHTAHLVEGYNTFATLIWSLYQRRLVPELFFTSEQDPTLRKGLTSVLAGDVWRADNPFQRRLLSSKRRRFDLRTPAQWS